MKLWLVSSSKNDAVYEVLDYDPSTGNAKLRGRYATIDQKLDVKLLKKAGYKLTKEKPHHA